MKDTVLTARVPAELSEQLEWLAASTDRSKSWLLLDALTSYLDLNRWQIQAIQEGVESYHKGEWTPHQEISDWLNTWGSN